MLEATGGNSFLILSVMVFVTVLLLLEALYLIWKSKHGVQAKKIEKRLRLLATKETAPEEVSFLKQGALGESAFIERLLQGASSFHGLQKVVNQSGMDWSVSKLVMLTIGSGVVTYMGMTVFMHQSVFFSGMTSLLFASFPFLYLLRRRSQRLSKLEQQLPEAIDLMIRALRSGHAFSSGLQMVGEEMAEPIANEFRIVHDEVNFGVSLQQALMNLSDRVPLTDLRYFVVAVLIQRESGGNLTEILANLSRLIRDRLKLLAKVKVLSSEGRLSAWVLGIMPFALAAIMNVVNPKFMSLLWTDPIGISIVKTMLTLMVIGAFLLRQIIKIKV